MSLNNESNKESFHFSDLNLEEVRQMLDNFALERNWEQYHLPRNLLLALIGEMGEIAENFQWRPDNDCKPGLKNWTEKERSALADELADVFIYLVRLSDRCRIDITENLVNRFNKS